MLTILSLVLSLSAQAAQTEHLGAGIACSAHVGEKTVMVYIVDIFAARTRNSGTARMIVDDLSRRPTIELADEVGSFQNGFAGVTYSTQAINLTFINGGTKAVGSLQGERIESKCYSSADIVRVTL